MRATIEVHYRDHSSIEEWEDSDLHCLFCGERKVWRECRDGDYYAGPQHICISCGGSFYIYGIDLDLYADMQRVAELLAEDEAHEEA